MVAAAAERLRQAFPGLAPDTYESIANALVLAVLDNLPVAGHPPHEYCCLRAALAAARATVTP
jgi:hypothetical protein